MAQPLTSTYPVLPRISDYPRHWAEADGARVAMVLGERRISYEQLARDVDRWAKFLIDAEVSPGDRVALLSPPCPDAVAIFLAAASIGAVFQGLNPKHRAGELAYVLGDAQPVMLLATLVDRDGLAVVEELAATTPSIRRVGGPDLAALLATSTSVSDVTLAAAQARVRTMDACALVYTSGSTGRTKGALLPHRGFSLASAVQAEHLFDGPGSIICNLPIDHVGALGNICASSLVTGGSVVFQERFDCAGVLELIEAERVEYWGAVPAAFQLSVRTPQWTSADLSSLRRILWSGGAASVALIDTLRARCPRVSSSYGLTESVGEVTFSDPNDDVDTLASTIGRPEPRYEVRIAREDGSTCNLHEEGEIVVRGDFIMLGYLNRPEATASAIDSDGWLHTGDLAWHREDGCFVLVGRKSEMFKSGGYNVYPREIELLLEDHPGVSSVAVIDVPDETYGQVGHAFVLADPAQVSADDLARFARKRIANYKLPKAYTIATDLPLLPIGKIDKAALRSSIHRKAD